MKAISLHQPYATLVALREKRFETRSWLTKHRGEIAIHASSFHRKWLDKLMEKQPFANALGDILIDYGAIVAVVVISSCKPAYEVFQELDRTSNEVAFGDFSTGRFAWGIENVRRLRWPIHCRGWQGIWNLEQTIEDKLRRELAKPDGCISPDESVWIDNDTEEDSL